MINLLEAIGIDPRVFVFAMVISSVILIASYRRFVVNLFDPLNFFILTMVADSTLVYGPAWPSDVKWEFATFAFCFWLGFITLYRRGGPPSNSALSFSDRAFFELHIVLICLSAIIVAANLWLGLTVGFPLLSLHPSQAKVTIFTGGLGLVRRMNMGPYLFLCCGCVLSAASGYRRWLSIFLLLGPTLFIALSGSKSALLPLVFVLAFALAHSGFGWSGQSKRRIKRLTLVCLLAGVVVALIVSIRDQGGPQMGAESLLARLVYSGDVILFYYPVRGLIPELTHRGLWAYVQYLLGGLLPLLRLADYKPALGTILLGGSDEGFGPNAQYFVRADIFFGPVFGCLYCFLIGAAVRTLRERFFLSRGGNIILFTFKFMLAVSAFYLTTESELFVTQTGFAFVMILPLWTLARLVSFASSNTAPIRVDSTFVEGV